MTNATRICLAQQHFRDQILRNRRNKKGVSFHVITSSQQKIQK